MIRDRDDLAGAEERLQAIQPTLGRLTVPSAAISEVLYEDCFVDTAQRGSREEEKDGGRRGEHDMGTNPS